MRNLAKNEVTHSIAMLKKPFSIKKRGKRFFVTVDLTSDTPMDQAQMKQMQCELKTQIAAMHPEYQFIVHVYRNNDGGNPITFLQDIEW